MFTERGFTATGIRLSGYNMLYNDIDLFIDSNKIQYMYCTIHVARKEVYQLVLQYGVEKTTTLVPVFHEMKQSGSGRRPGLS